MKQRLILAGCVLVLAGLPLFMSCSNPLEPGPQPVPPITDTLYLTDTLLHTDTVEVSDSILVPDTILITDTLSVIDSFYITDTLMQVDTLWELDTLLMTDTVFVQDSCEAPALCGRLDSHRKEIVWILNNTAGPHRLEFTAVVEKDKPPQTVFLTIDGQPYYWEVQANAHLTVDAVLGDRAMITIVSTSPRALGHAIDICLSVTTP